MKEWLSGIVGESTANILGFVLIFALILAAIFVLLAIVRRFGGGSFPSSNRTRQPRLSVMDAAAVDSRRKLVLIRRDDVEHLLLIGGPTDVVVEQNIVLQSRAHSLSPSQSKIEPQHVERFRQHEATLSVDKPSPSLSAPEKAPELKEIQLNSAVESKPYSKPAPVEVRPIEPAFQPARPIPPAPQPDTSIRREPQVATPSTPPQPRPAPSYPPQPRTVQPASDVSNKTATRSHPPYPLSQVSRGVVAATSTAAVAATVGAAALQPKPAPASVDDATARSPKPEVEAAPAVNFAASAKEPVAEPQVDIRPAEPVVATESKLEPVLVIEEETVEIVSIEQSIGSDIENALNDAIMADLETKKPEAHASRDAEDTFTLDSLEDKLLGSLDITPDGDDVKSKSSESSIEDEMAKLLGELSNDERPKR